MKQPRLRLTIANTDCDALRRSAQHEERKPIAQELHDTLLQGFTRIALKLDALATSLPPALSKPNSNCDKPSNKWIMIDTKTVMPRVARPQSGAFNFGISSGVEHKDNLS